MREIFEKKKNDLLRKDRLTATSEMLLDDAFEEVVNATNGKLRDNNAFFVTHALAVAAIIADMKLYAQMPGITTMAITAIFLHESDRFFHFDKKVIEEKYGKTIADIVLGLRKISEIDFKTTRLQVDIFSKLLISYSTHPLIILIKLADRLEVMRSLSYFSKNKQEKKSAETMLLFSPIAHKLGLYKLYAELDDLSLRYMEPDSYRDIATKLHPGEDARNKLASNFIRPINSKLKRAGLKFVVKQRTKSVYSIYKKMQKQKLPFESVYDVFAIRIIIDCDIEEEKDCCWKAYSIVTAQYTPDTSRLRDWITVPKSNGYESLHITVETEDKNFVEIQIRSKRMDDNAENGTAAHFLYKGIAQDKKSSTENWLNNIKNMLSGSSKEDENVVPELQEVFVFTPNGDLRQLPKGATVLDFAYDIHSGIGAKCTSAVINGRHASIREVVQTGDTVAIQTSKNQKPSKNWLDFVITQKARLNIRRAVRKQEEQEQERASSILKNSKKTEQENTKEVPKTHYSAENITENDYNSGDYITIDKDLTKVEYRLAKCCHPILGDSIFGFITIGKGISIHRSNCPNADQMLKNSPYRIIQARWKNDTIDGAFQASVKIVAEDVVAAEKIIIQTVEGTSAKIRSVRLIPQRELLTGQIQVYVKNSKQMDILLSRLQALKFVHKAIRLKQ
ncbi:MAG: HD domain-containing protein [Bacteroidales bacterium]|jgi:GTP pyrophosphokinase|nr:HD domain-containing protein [Bacteroidales bacterium]